MMGRWGKKDAFYYPRQEVPLNESDKYRYLDAATRGVLQKASGRISLLMCLILVCFAVIVGRLFQLTVLHYQARQFAPSVLKTDFELGRKDILDRNGVILATSLPTVDLSVNPRQVKNPEEVARRISEALPDVSFAHVLHQIHSGGTFRYIKRNLTPKERNDVNWLGYHFLSETPGEKRVYPQGRLCAHLLGGVDIDNRGIAGLEKAYDARLKEEDVVLALDVSAQEMLRQTLVGGLETYGAEGALGIVADVRSGEILAAVSLPDYDPNLPAGSPDESRFNRMSLGIYEFGSVFKLFNTALGLETDGLKLTDRFDASKPIKVGRKLIEDYRGQNRVLSVPEILMHSSNIGSSLIALDAGYQKQRAFLARFGFYERLPVELPERGAPQYPTRAQWNDLKVANVAYGYGISVTPLHLIAAVGALVNGGYYLLPAFLKNGNAGKPEYQVVSPKTSEDMRHLMWAAVNWDMKKNHPAQPYHVGGKTGSANLRVDGKYATGKLRTSFVGVFPMNQPRYAVLVVLENPQRRKEDWMFNTAGWNAKVLALDIVAQIAPYLGVPPQPEWEHPAAIRAAIETTLEQQKR